MAKTDSSAPFVGPPVGGTAPGAMGAGSPGGVMPVGMPSHDGRPNERPDANDAAGSSGLGASAPGGAGRPNERPDANDAAGSSGLGASAPGGEKKTAAPPTPKGESFWKRHPVDIRFSLPFFGGRFYIAALSGRERRPAERRDQERHHYPLRTAANFFFVLGLGAAFYALALVVLAFTSAIVEW